MTVLLSHEWKFSHTPDQENADRSVLLRPSGLILSVGNAFSVRRHCLVRWWLDNGVAFSEQRGMSDGYE